VIDESEKLVVRADGEPVVANADGQVVGQLVDVPSSELSGRTACPATNRVPVVPEPTMIVG
jgi:hypothetical protein